MSFVSTTSKSPDRTRARLKEARAAAPAAQRAKELASLRVTAQRLRAVANEQDHDANIMLQMGETGMSQSPYIAKYALQNRQRAAEASARARELGGWA